MSLEDRLDIAIPILATMIVCAFLAVWNASWLRDYGRRMTPGWIAATAMIGGSLFAVTFLGVMLWGFYGR